MQNSKLYSILESFNKYEQNRLRKFLISPYFNKNEALVKLFDALVSHINADRTAEIEKEVLWGNIYEKDDIDDVLFRKNCSDLLKLIESFLAQQVYEENPIHQVTYLLEAVGKKKTDRLFNSTMKSSRRLSDQQPFRTASHYFQQYQIEKSYYELTQHELKRAEKSNVEEIFDNLDKFYFAEKLRWYTSVLSQQFLVSHEYNLLFIEEILEHLKVLNYDHVPPIAIYFQIYLTLKEPETEDHYYKLKNLLAENGLKFPIIEAKNMYYSAINYCIRKSNIEGKQNFLNELLDIYKDLLTKEIILTGDGLSPWDFKNIVSCGLRLGEFEWTENFIRKYSQYIPESHRENAVSFNLAQLYFFQKKYVELIQLLQTVEYEDFAYNLNAKMFLLTTYYELDEIEPLFSLLESFRTYLNRHKDFPKQRRDMYINLIKYTKTLSKIIPSDKKAISILKEQIIETKNLSGREWLLEKIAELET